MLNGTNAVGFSGAGMVETLVYHNAYIDIPGRLPLTLGRPNYDASNPHSASNSKSYPNPDVEIRTGFSART